MMKLLAAHRAVTQLDDLHVNNLVGTRTIVSKATAAGTLMRVDKVLLNHEAERKRLTGGR
jgi:hypothetical protein